MRVIELWRHPVKSMQGERLEEASIGVDGLDGDRSWGVRDPATGHVLTGRREPRLLLASARLEEGAPLITLPDGAVVHGTGTATDAALSAWLEHPVTLAGAADEGDVAARAEMFADATDDTSAVVEWDMPAGKFVDVAPLLLLTTATIRAAAAGHAAGVWDVRRFRPNVFVEADGDDWVEDSWIGGRVRIGALEADVLAACSRCTMVTRRQPGLERDLDVFRTVNRLHGGTFGVWGWVQDPGVVRVGDEVLPPSPLPID